MSDLDRAILERHSTRMFLPRSVPRECVWMRPSLWPGTRRRTRTSSRRGWCSSAAPPGVACKGQEWDWLGDPFWRLQTSAVFFTVGLAGLIFWELRHRNPVVNFCPLGERNFAGCWIIIFCAYLALYAASTSLPGLLQSLFGYDALNAGLVMSPGGVFAVLAMPVVGRLLGRGTDARWLIAAGLLIMTAGNYWMSQLNLDISPGQAVWPRVLVVAGLAVCFAPANVAAYLYTPMALRGAAVGLVEPSAQRGRQRRDVISPDLPRAARSIPHSASW
jgi:Major Facilitator Superfamily